MWWLRFKRNYVKKKEQDNTVLYEKWGGELKHTPHTHRDLNEPYIHANTYVQSKTSWKKKKQKQKQLTDIAVGWRGQEAAALHRHDTPHHRSSPVIVM